MPVPDFTPFTGLLPSEGDPATFPPRAQALFEWFTVSGAPQLANMSTGIAGALEDMQEVYIQTNTAKVNAVAARGGSEAARTGAETARAASEVARTASETAQAKAETAAANSQTFAKYADSWSGPGLQAIGMTGDYPWQVIEIGPGDGPGATRPQATASGYDGAAVASGGAGVWHPDWSKWIWVNRPTMWGLRKDAEEESQARKRIINSADGDFFAYGKRLSLAMLDDNDRVGIALDAFGTILGKLGIDAAPEIEVSFDAATGVTSLSLSTNPTRVSLPSGAAITGGDVELYVAGKKIRHALMDSNDRVAFGITPEGATLVHSLALGGSETVSVAQPEYVNGKAIARAWKDAQGRIAMAILEDGSVFAHGLDAGGGGEVSVPQEPWLLNEIAIYGDSLSAPLANTQAWEEATGLPVYNRGIGGQASPQICGRFGSTVYGVTLENNTIVAGENRIELFDGVAPQGIATGGGMQPLILSTPATTYNYGDVQRMPNGVTIGNVRGTLKRIAAAEDEALAPRSTSEEYRFIPYADEVAELPCRISANTPMIVDQIEDWRRIVIIHMGANDGSADYDETTWPNLLRMAEALQSNGNYRFVFLTFPTGGYGNTDEGDAKRIAMDKINFNILRTWPQNSFDQNRWLINNGIREGIAAGHLPNDGSVPSAQDLADIDNDIVPTSLRKDLIHWHDWVYGLLVPAIHTDVILRKGFLQ